MTVDDDKPLLDAAIRLDNIKAAGRTLKVKATADQCEAIAKRLDIESVDGVEANLHASTMKGGILLKGQLVAKVSQLCVVSFVPVPEQINETVERIFLSGNETETDPAPGSETFVDLEGDDLPDYFEGPEIDVSALLLEVLSLALNPHPRAKDAEVENPLDAEKGEESPFAVLKQLKSTRD